ncbi:hypothetical protein H112_02343 [Trichophyton rubrum D6]|uniref:Uncharacterized protein n=3 Tax=Trichophyton TaxID=5550 RepID=A0A080WVS2_TRIRC|nr:uncharacterized protein TERG_12368 [Trichophyton rubrum CBS 118892]EZF25367.1 hypothetical protein H100_02344 [Trichophyton rubrum MR850]EZF44355.1 hypothetical protein H102_02342 [Trichophyton rubrum CBS 100081]EZF54967.1 hypothetical protein H103_02352 [Trichophyton rubrum CBS 288.86]EZF65616.1 hypothetical protein H104_02328 [Trichophyton rubrum CBS 289.86]EZF76212.1 hypothetical protein H105_02362 [Trichophyton soudanense CBS 452.61]EZF86923.1 hypothetical protein H110_02348 [Trichophy
MGSGPPVSERHLLGRAQIVPCQTGSACNGVSRLAEKKAKRAFGVKNSRTSYHRTLREGWTRYLLDIIAARSNKISQFPFDVELLHCSGVTATRCLFRLSRTLLRTTYFPPFYRCCNVAPMVTI